LTTRDTVIGETPAWCATSSMVTAPPFLRIALSFFMPMLPNGGRNRDYLRIEAAWNGFSPRLHLFTAPPWRFKGALLRCMVTSENTHV
jgi:hypothetical protein